MSSSSASVIAIDESKTTTTTIDDHDANLRAQLVLSYLETCETDKIKRTIAGDDDTRDTSGTKRRKTGKGRRNVYTLDDSKVAMLIKWLNTIESPTIDIMYSHELVGGRDIGRLMSSIRSGFRRGLYADGERARLLSGAHPVFDEYMHESRHASGRRGLFGSNGVADVDESTGHGEAVTEIAEDTDPVVEVDENVTEHESTGHGEAATEVAGDTDPVVEVDENVTEQESTGHSGAVTGDVEDTDSVAEVDENVTEQESTGHSEAVTGDAGDTNVDEGVVE
jgi:hypothetical protein